MLTRWFGAERGPTTALSCRRRGRLDKASGFAYTFAPSREILFGSGAAGLVNSRNMATGVGEVKPQSTEQPGVRRGLVFNLPLRAAVLAVGVQAGNPC